ncbi:MAG: hypothetical protein OEW21_18050 [Betaproteobacteria bacterium]|nr:hypothetical protein [Betaproteobacteria bacterium]
MELDDYLRDKAVDYRIQAQSTPEEEAKEELLELAVVCEEIANSIEDRLTGG